MKLKPSSSIFSISITLILLFFHLKLSECACHVDDEAGLLAFKSGITADPMGLLSTWKPGTDCCSWSGVTCRENNRVTMLYLVGQPDNSSSFLSGTISPSLSKVQNLDGVYLMDLKKITGNFPQFLYQLPKLQFVYLENNKLSGQIPTDIGSKLRQLGAFSVYGNAFSGSIPDSISEMTQLTQLKLGDNLLTGTIPVGIRNLTNLSFLSLEKNRLSGPVPDIFGSFADLRILRLSHNRFTGKFPASIAALAPLLQYLELGYNRFTGSIPDFLGKFKALDTLDLSWNQFSGVVPKSFANLTKIFNLDLSHNLLVDPFPTLYVKGIESLHLSYNNFHLGAIPGWVTSSSVIYSLRLAKCGIKMKMEDWNPKETYFYDYIDLSDNEITGSPVGLLNRTDYLVGFWASGNKLKFDIGSLRKIIPSTTKQLDLSRNQIYGNLTQIGDEISRLQRFNVSYNNLCGQIPVGASKFPATSFQGNKCLCGSPLPPCKKA